MTAKLGTTVVGVFADRKQAEEALAELMQAGFGPDKIAITKQQEARPGVPEVPDPEMGIGLITGAALGGLAGGPVGLLSGAVVGTFLGWLLDLGVPEADARFYEAEAADGRSVVTAAADGRQDEARAILRRHGAREAPAPAAVTVSSRSVS